MSEPSALPVEPPFAIVFRFTSVTENNIGRFVRLPAPDTFVWSIVIALRFVHTPPTLYQGGPPPPVVIVYTAELIELLVIPAAYAIALMVTVPEATETGPP